MAFRPRLIPTLMTVPMLIALLALGTWQMQRLYWKEALIDKLQTRATAEAVALPTSVDAPEDWEFQRVALKGRYLHDKEMFLINRSLNGNPGVHILTPFERADGGGHVLVNRGWVAFERRDDASLGGWRRPEGQLSVDGIVRVVRGPGWFTPDNDAEDNVWFFVDTAEMSDAAGVPLAEAVYVVSSGAETDATFPVGKQWRLDIRNDHLEYALTWYLLALGLIAIYILYHRRPN